MSVNLAATTWLYPTATAASSHSVPIPSGNSGELLLLVISSTNAATASASGWTELFALNRPLMSGQDRLTVLYRIADGSEGSSVSVSLSASENFAAICHRITGYDSGTGMSYSTATSSGSSAPNPPSHSPAAGSRLYLWLAVMATSGARYVTATPTGWDVCPLQLFNGAGATTARTTLASVGKQQTASSNDPGTFTLNTTFEWVAATIAVPVSASSGGGLVLGRGFRGGYEA